MAIAISRLAEVAGVFLRLGLTSFGGPVAHLGYFREEFVRRRRWLDDDRYAELVALCQFLPGPASSQVGFAIGWLRGGWAGAGAAWLAFTAPSALLMGLVGIGLTTLDHPIVDGVLVGLKLAAVAIVAQAVLGMARTLCPDRARATIGLGAFALVLLFPYPMMHVLVIALGALAGLGVCGGLTGDGRVSAPSRIGNHGWVSPVAGGLFLLLLLGLPLWASAGGGAWVSWLDAFYRTGALVFGGGHVVLPLLEAEVVAGGWVDSADFMAGYGAAQAIPGPLFTVAAYLGVVANTQTPLLYAVLALCMLFLPGLLLVMALLPHWQMVRSWQSVQAVLRGANAAVVGILGAALYDPLWTGSVVGAVECVLAITAFILLVVWAVSPLAVVTLLALGGVLITL